MPARVAKTPKGGRTDVGWLTTGEGLTEEDSMELLALVTHTRILLNGYRLTSKNTQGPLTQGNSQAHYSHYSSYSNIFKNRCPFPHMTQEQYNSCRVLDHPWTETSLNLFGT
jgi:hypothetical protein